MKQLNQKIINAKANKLSHKKFSFEDILDGNYR